MEKNSAEEALIEAMFKAGAHFGYSKTRRHPSLKDSIFGTKNKNDILDLSRAVKELETAKIFVSSLSTSGKVLLFVGVKPEARTKTHEVAMALDMPYVILRWVGGILTNWSEIKKRIARLLELREQKAKGELGKYTKKEQLLLDQEMTKMDSLFGGLVSLKKIPDAIFVVDAKREHIAVTEAHKAGIPIIALVNSDTNKTGIDYPIVANDASVSSISFFLDQIADAYKKGHLQVATVEPVQ